VLGNCTCVNKDHFCKDENGDYRTWYQLPINPTKRVYDQEIYLAKTSQWFGRGFVHPDQVDPCKMVHVVRQGHMIPIMVSWSFRGPPFISGVNWDGSNNWRGFMASFVYDQTDWSCPGEPEYDGAITRGGTYYAFGIGAFYDGTFSNAWIDIVGTVVS
jgi:hypothetical protein